MLYIPRDTKAQGADIPDVRHIAVTDHRFAAQSDSDARTDGDELAVALRGMLEEVAGTHEQQLTVAVLQADRPVDFTELLQSTARCIRKGLENDEGRKLD